MMIIKLDMKTIILEIPLSSFIFSDFVKDINKFYIVYMDDEKI